MINFAIGKVGSEYAQLGIAADGSAIELPGSFLDPFDLEAAVAEFTPIGDTLFLLEAAQQHHPATYQRLLNAPRIGALAAKVKRIAAKLGATPA